MFARLTSDLLVPGPLWEPSPDKDKDPVSLGPPSRAVSPVSLRLTVIPALRVKSHQRNEGRKAAPALTHVPWAKDHHRHS